MCGAAAGADFVLHYCGSFAALPPNQSDEAIYRDSDGFLRPESACENLGAAHSCTSCTKFLQLVTATRSGAVRNYQ